MYEVGAYHAKTHLAELLDRIEAGESVMITRHGRPVARLAPPEIESPLTFDQAVGELRAFRDSHLLGTQLTVKQLIREGRRS